jgi:methionyl-tRNA synthetase
MNTVLGNLEKFLDELQTHRYLEELWKLFSIGNKAIEEHAPWVKMKEGKKDEALATVALVANILAKASVMLNCIMPSTTTTISQALGFSINTEVYTSLILEKELLKPFVIAQVPPLFPRVEQPLLEQAPEANKPESETACVPEPQSAEEDNLITIDQFFQTSLKIGTIVEAEEVPKSKKLLKLQVDVGEGKMRQVVAGIREYYSAESLLNTQVCVVSNLKPAKLMGMLSEGMLLAAKDENGLCLVRPESPRKAGSSVG